MQNIWDRITSWLTIHAPKVLKSLQPGATEDEIREVEEKLGVTFPVAVRQSFRIYNGQNKVSGPLIPQHRCPEDLDDFMTAASGGWKLLSLAEIVMWWNEWMTLRDLGEAEWNQFWIPLTYDEGGNHDCLDLDPKLGQDVGRIINVCHEYIPDVESDPEFKQSVNFSVWLESFATDLESNLYKYAEEYDRLVDAEALRKIRLNFPIQEARIQDALQRSGFGFDE